MEWHFVFDRNINSKIHKPLKLCVPTNFPYISYYKSNIEIWKIVSLYIVVYDGKIG